MSSNFLKELRVDFRAGIDEGDTQKKYGVKEGHASATNSIFWLKSLVPDTFQLGAISPFCAFLADRTYVFPIARTFRLPRLH